MRDAMRSTTEPSSRTEADAWLRERARRTVWAHLNTRDDADFAPSVKSMIEQTQREYSGRFLFELIQNAYDRQPRDSVAGPVAIILVEDEGDHGTLYVANTGTGFSASDVRRIGSLGLSDKQVGEGIGNKGIGFKSVLQVCTTPEVYSTLSHGEPGFCFRFATTQDIPGLVGGSPVHEAQVLEELSLYNLTLPTENVPARVAELWAEGFATVVRLPLHVEAVNVVNGGVAEIESSDVPVMLFLDRLRRIEVRRESDGRSDAFILARERGPSLDLGGGLDGNVVDLAAEGRFLMFYRDVDPDTVRHVLQDAVATGTLDKRWGDWKAPVTVSIALTPGAPDAHVGRFYTYLPMGPKAPSPFAGHLNAPFFTNFARTDVPLDHPLNDVLLREIARLCLDGAEALTRSVDSSAPDEVLDALMWADDYLPILAGEARLTGAPLPERPVVPTHDQRVWTTLQDACQWPSNDTTVLTAERAQAACGVHFLPVLPSGRQTRLSALMAAMDLNPIPQPDRLADWVEAMTAAMAAERLPISDWEAAYADIAILFARNPDALRGRAVLLTDDWELRPCAVTSRVTDGGTGGEATPFFPPARQRVDDEDEMDPDADLDLPRSLARRMFYLNRELTWYSNRQQTRARRFLQSNGLVRRFDTRSILEHVRGLLSRTRSHQVARDALTLVFNLTRAGASTKVNVSEIGLRVPTAGGAWIAAQSCYFSTGWPGTSGEDLSTIASTPDDRSAELHALSDLLLAPGDQLVRTSSDVGEWTRFLRQAGVRDVIELASITDERGIDGQWLVKSRLSQIPGLPEPVHRTWQEQLPTTSGAASPYTPYKALSPLFWLPGQGDWERLTDRVRRALARQILIGLKGPWGDSALDTVWEKDRPYGKDRVLVPTPLRAFLTVTSWLPVQRPGQAGSQLVRPGQCWTFPTRTDRSEDGPPRFAPLLTKTMRDLLDDDPTGIAGLRRLGVGMWSSDADAARLVRHLGKLAADGAVADVHSSQFQAMYRGAWAACANRGQMPLPEKARSYLVADVGGLATPMPVEPMGDDAEPIDLVVASATEDRSLLRLLTDFRRPILMVDSQVEKVVMLLRRRLGEQVIAATEVAPIILVDGMPFQGTHTAQSRPLIDLVPQLPILIGTLLEFRRSSFDRSGQRAFDETLDALRRVRVVHASRVEVRIGEDVRPLPERLNGILPMVHPDAPSLVLEHPEGKLTWHTIEVLAEPLLYLIGRPNFTDALRLAAARLRAAEVPLGELDDDDLAIACGVSAADVRTTTRRVETALAPLLTRLYPVVVHCAGSEAAATFDPEATAITSEAEARDALSRLADQLPCTPRELLDAALDASSLDELRQAIRIPVKLMNETLASLGGRYPAIDYGAQHADDFADHVRARRGQILDRIRWARWHRFAAFEPQSDWTTIRHVDAVTPDPGWGTTVDGLSTEQMDQRIEVELVRLLGEAPPKDGDPLRSVSECSRANTDLIAPRVGRLTQLVRAWLTAHGQPISAWADTDSTGRTVLDALDGCGALDFTVLSMGEALTWLKVLGLWPEGMPGTDDPSALGLSTDDLDAQRSEERRRRAEAARMRRTVLVDDRPFDLDDGLAQFAATLDSSLARTPAFLAVSNRHTRLHPVPEGTGGRSGFGGGGSGGGSRAKGLSDQQRIAVGFAGEWLTYQWLAQVHGNDFGPECWVSEYRREMFAEAGDDSLGWDFEVPVRRLTYYYEVKTTLGDGGQIELGESQVRAAQRNAKNEQWRLIVVTNVLNGTRRLHVLRNPFHEKSRGLFTFVGQGLRLRYEFIS